MALYLNNKTETIVFLYRWSQKSTGKWYEGSRTANKCYSDDGYICSNCIKKPMILENQDDRVREILVIGEPKLELIKKKISKALTGVSRPIKVKNKIANSVAKLEKKVVSIVKNYVRPLLMRDGMVIIIN